MNKEIIKGNVDIILLILASKKPMYGYQIAKELRDMTNNFYQLGEGTLYPALKRLEDKNLLEYYWEDVEEKNLKRKYYKITNKGISELQLRLENWRLFNILIEKLIIQEELSND